MSGSHIGLFLLYCILFCLIITKWQAFKNASVSRVVFIAVFLIKIIAGVGYGYIYSRQPYLQASDVWQVFDKSLVEYHRLLHDPIGFAKTAFVFTGDISYTNFTQTETSYWNILKEVILIKFEAILDVLSFGNYYVNAVLYGFLVFTGCNLFFRTLERIFPGRSYFNLVSSFLVPSTMFWTSAVYKDGLLFCLMSFVVYQTMKWLNGARKDLIYWVTLGLSLIGAFLLRTYVPLLIIPPLTSWILVEKWNFTPALAFTYVYGVCAALIVLSKYIYPPFDVIHLLAVWQHSFLELPANSALPASRLEPTLPGVFRNLPQSINFGLLRPFLWENKGKQYLLFAAELLVMQALFLISVFSKEPLTSRQSAFRLFCFCLAITGCLFLGYTVHIIGALVRYRSIFFPFLFAAILSTLPLPAKSK